MQSFASRCGRIVRKRAVHRTLLLFVELGKNIDSDWQKLEEAKKEALPGFCKLQAGPYC